MIELGIATAEMTVGRELRKKYISMPNAIAAPASRSGLSDSAGFRGTIEAITSATIAPAMRKRCPSSFFDALREQA